VTDNRFKKLVKRVFTRPRSMRPVDDSDTYSLPEDIDRLMKSYEEDGLHVRKVWYTAEDAHVCTICGPRHGKVKGDGWEHDPPAHDGCRCAVVLEFFDE
jgi:hypothetical protein